MDTRSELRLVAGLLKTKRFDVSSEMALVAGMARVLARGDGWREEWPLPGAGRVDFWHGGMGIAVEAKVKGSPTAVLEQVLRYAYAPPVLGVLLVTGRAALGRGLPDTLGDKPFEVVELWEGCL